MEENTITMQALVMAHACYGHNSFFKNNYLFRSWTDASSIVDYLIFARKIHLPIVKSVMAWMKWKNCSTPAMR